MPKIIDLPAVGALTGAEVLPVVQGGVTKQTPISGIAGLLSTPYKAQIGFDSPLGAAERLRSLYFVAATTFPANFANNGGYVETAPAATWRLNYRLILSDGTDSGIVGYLQVATNKAMTRATNGGVDLVIPAGSTLRPEGPATPDTTAGLTEVLIAKA